MICKGFSHIVDGSYILLMVPFAVQRLFNLIQSRLFSFVFIACAIGVISKIELSRPMSRSFPTIFPLGLLVSGSTFKSSVHFELTLVNGVR